MTGTQLEIEPIASQLPVKQSTPMELLHVALQNNAAIDVIERLAALQEKMLLRKGEEEFNHAMLLTQAEMKRIEPDAYNKETQSKWATYAKMDKELRPIYVKHGFSLSFSTDDCPVADTERIICYVSRGGHTRRYQKDIPADGRGPKGGGVMSKVHASGQASSYGMRYLLKMIFNVAIGEDDTDGNAPSGPEMEGLEDYCTAIRDAQNFEDMDKAFRQGYSAASGIKSGKAKAALAQAREEWRKRTKAGVR